MMAAILQGGGVLCAYFLIAAKKYANSINIIYKYK